MIINYCKSFIYELLPNSCQARWDRIEQSRLGNRLLRGAFWSIAGAVVSRGLMLFASVFIARMLGREIYGEFGILRSTVNMFVVFAGFGLGITATKHVAEFRERSPDRAGRIITMSELFSALTGSLVAVGVFVFAPWIATHTINAPHLIYEIRIVSIILLLSALNGAQTGALTGLESFSTIARVNVWIGLLSFPILIIATYLGSLRGALYALAANAALNWVLNHLALRQEMQKYGIRFVFAGLRQEFATLWRFSLPAAMSGFVVTPVLWGCNVMMVNRPGGYGQMALFDAANQWRTTVLFIPSMVGSIVLPMLSNLSRPEDRNDYMQVLRYNILANVILTTIPALGVSLISPYIMSGYGPEFSAGYMVLAVMVFTAVLMSVTSVIGQAIVSRNRVWIGLAFNSLWAITVITLSYFFIQKGMGALGLAMGNLISYILHSFWQYLYLQHLMRCHDGR